MYCFFSPLVHSKIGSGCASVLNTHWSRGISSSSVKRRYKYFNLYGPMIRSEVYQDLLTSTYVSAMKKLCNSVSSISNKNEFTNNRNGPWHLVELRGRGLFHGAHTGIARWRLSFLLDSLENSPSSFPPLLLPSRSPHKIEALHGLHMICSMILETNTRQKKTRRTSGRK